MSNSLNPDAIIARGIGFGALLIASYGFLGIPDEQPEGPLFSGSSVPTQQFLQQPSLRAQILDEDEFIVVFLAAVTEAGLLEPK